MFSTAANSVDKAAGRHLQVRRTSRTKRETIAPFEPDFPEGTGVKRVSCPNNDNNVLNSGVPIFGKCARTNV